MGEIPSSSSSGFLSVAACIDKDGLKRELVHTLGAGDDQVALLSAFHQQFSAV
jgi:hypothetical protein